MKNLSIIFKIAATYTAVILGAGFASGQELMSFFIRYGIPGFVGIIGAGFLLFAIAYFVMAICLKQNIGNYDELLIFLFGDKLSMLVEIFVAFSFFAFSSAMLSAGGAALNQAFGIGKVMGILIFAALCFITLLKGVDGIINTNVILAPLMVISGVFIGLYAFMQGNGNVAHNPEVAIQNVFSSALLYASFNIVTAVSVLVALKSTINSKKTAFWSSLMGGVLITVMAISISLPLLTNYNSVRNLEIPMLQIAMGHGDFLPYLYLLTLTAAMFTTAVANFFTLNKWLEVKIKGNIKGNIFVTVFIIIFSAIFANLGFTNFVHIAYPMFGVVGLVQVVAIIKGYIKSSLGGENIMDKRKKLLTKVRTHANIMHVD
ncbi:MAG: hypothetical protein FWE29_00570 [Defluviitaleaceae bacterium]|nr:hypothetical protein [Defluviitaleaceae bacterium]